MIVMRDQTSCETKHATRMNSLEPMDEENRYESPPPPPPPPTRYQTFAVPPHPLEIKPAGNAYTAAKNSKSAAGLFSNLADELIIQVLESLSGRLLLQLGATCKALYAFCMFDDLWKTLCIEYVFFLPAA